MSKISIKFSQQGVFITLKVLKPFCDFNVKDIYVINEVKGDKVFKEFLEVVSVTIPNIEDPLTRVIVLKDISYRKRIKPNYSNLENIKTMVLATEDEAKHARNQKGWL